MQEYADKYHHPKEELIYNYYLNSCAVASDIEHRLRLDHQRLKDETLELNAVVEMILMDAVVPLDQFSSKLEHYINSQFNHLKFEDTELLPAIAKALSADDWKQIEQNWQHADLDDPLFGRKVAQRYQQLAERIKAV